MAHQVFDEVYKDGVLVSSTARTVSDLDEARDQAVPNIRAAYATLRQWSVDAAAMNTNWPTMTAAQKDAAMRETIRRLGIFFDRFGDLALYLRLDP